MNSKEKVQEFAEQQLAAAGGDVLSRSLTAFAPMALSKLPDDPAVLDGHLYQWAAVALLLRSDDAEQLAIVRVSELEAHGVRLVADEPPVESTAVEEPATALEAGS